MTDQDKTLLIQDIINKAVEGKALPFRSILYWGEFKYYCKCVASTKIIIKVLKQSANNLFKEYCKDVIAGISDVNKLLAYSQFLDIISFYKSVGGGYAIDIRSFRKDDAKTAANEICKD